ncbi:MFS transporter, partial [Kineococcus sp. T13]|uniref:MFS transporter n=1 Tax=Kineococcus vitellinus TaxID=2696565 RepID=UPI0014129650|nr:MFS transporter [Kineococcus vitellinus]
MHPPIPAGRRRTALFAVFAVQGVAFASWVTRTPGIRDAVQASTSGMGLVLLGLSAGAMAGILASPGLVTRRGARSVVLSGGLLQVVGVATVAAGAGAGSAPLVAGGLALFGAGTGSAEIAVNVEGADVERALGRSVLPVLHGCFSAGTFAGALAGVALTATEVPVPVHLGAVALLLLVVVAAAVRSLPDGTGREPVRAHRTGPRPAVHRERRVLLLAVLVLGMALAEGSASDWLPLIVVDGFGLEASAGALVYAVFGLAMALGRVGGGPLVDRVGRVPVLRASAVLAAVGLLLVVLAPWALLGALGVLCWGLGAALGFPLGVSAAGDEAEGATARVSFVATGGYLAFLVG